MGTEGSAQRGRGKMDSCRAADARNSTWWIKAAAQLKGSSRRAASFQGTPPLGGLYRTVEPAFSWLLMVLKNRTTTPHGDFVDCKALCKDMAQQQDGGRFVSIAKTKFNEVSELGPFPGDLYFATDVVMPENRQKSTPSSGQLKLYSANGKMALATKLALLKKVLDVTRAAASSGSATTTSVDFSDADFTYISNSLILEKEEDRIYVSERNSSLHDPKGPTGRVHEAATTTTTTSDQNDENVNRRGTTQDIRVYALCIARHVADPKLLATDLGAAHPTQASKLLTLILKANALPDASQLFSIGTAAVDLMIDLAIQVLQSFPSTLPLIAGRVFELLDRAWPSARLTRFAVLLGEKFRSCRLYDVDNAEDDDEDNDGKGVRIPGVLESAKSILRWIITRQHSSMMPQVDPLAYQRSHTRKLPVVRDTYASAEAYLATYYNLLRYDCLAQFKYSLDQLCRGDWEVLKDCKAYIVMPTGFTVSERGVVAQRMLCWRLEIDKSCEDGPGVKVTAVRRPIMSGCLVALSSEGLRFQNAAVWYGTVEASNLPKIKSNVFKAKASLVEVASAGDTFDDPQDDKSSDFMGGRSANSALMLKSLVGPPFHLMVECKVFAKAFVPALQTIKSLLPHEIALIDQITRAEGGAEGLPWTEDLLRSIARLPSPDESQRSALQAMCKSPLCVVQGPPGTGKSYVGSIYGALLCKWGEYPIRRDGRDGSGDNTDDDQRIRILVVTYKNRALDDFLTSIIGQMKDMIADERPPVKKKQKGEGGKGGEPEERDRMQGRVIRLGGRSTDEQIEKFAFMEEMKRWRWGGAYYNEKKEFENDIKSVVKRWQKLRGRKIKMADIIAQQATPRQLESFMKACPKTCHQHLSVFPEGLPDKAYLSKVRPCVEAWVGAAGWSKRESSLQVVFRRARKQEIAAAATSTTTTSKWKAVDRDPDSESKEGKAVVGEPDSQLKEGKSLKTGKQDDGDIPVDRDRGDNSEDEEELQATFGSKSSAPQSKSVAFLPRLTETPGNFGGATLSASGASASPLLRSCDDVWRLSDEQKLQLLTIWVQDELESMSYDTNCIDDHCESWRGWLDSSAARQKPLVLRDTQVVACTITGAAINHRLLKDYRPNVIIAEEAAEVSESLMIPTLFPSVKQLILIGDHQQLRPLLNEYPLRKNNRFDISLFERLFVHSSPSLPKCQLRFQSRMAEELAELPRLFYPNYTSSKRISDENRKLHPTLRSRMFWVSKPEYQESRPETGPSFINLKEAEDILAVVGRLIREGCSPDSITVLCAYQGQRRYIMKLLGARHPSEKVEEGKPNATPRSRVICHTIDNCQGDENDYVLVSLVRSTRLGFLKERNRLIVSISRGRRGTYFFGSKELLESDKGGWARVLDHLRNKSLVGDEMEYCCPRHSAARLRGDEMCREVCGMEMSCGHVCPKLCHHLRCPTHGLTEKCPSGCAQASHPPCHVTLEKQCVKCNSHYDVECHTLKISRCRKIVTASPACGHPYVVVCGLRDKSRICTEPVQANCVGCGAEVTTTCEVKHKRPKDISCKQPCKKTLDCGHACTSMCGQPCMSVEECQYCIANRNALTEVRKKKIAVLFEETEREAPGAFEEKLLSYDERSGRCPLDRASLPPIGVFVERRGQLPVVSRLVEIRLSGKAMLNHIDLLKEMEVLVDPKLLVIPYLLKQGTLDSNLVKDPTEAFKGKFVNAYDKYEVPEKFEGNVFTFLLCEVQLGRCQKLDAFKGSQTPPEGYHSQYSILDKAYRIWKKTAVKPEWFVEVQFCREGLPPLWQSTKGQLCHVATPEWLLAALKRKSCCMGGRDGSSGWLSGVKEIRVYRIQNESLWRAYQGFREGLKARAPAELKEVSEIQPKMKTFSNKGVENEPLDSTINEFYLFHGTNLAETIVREGFDNRVARSGLFGEGTYFTETICKAGQYTTTQQIIVSRVIMGDCQKAERFSGRRPDVNPRTSKPHDSVFGEGGVHREYIVFDRSQVMPEYLLTFS